MRIKGDRKDIVVCPQCGYRFSVTYSRAFSCGACPAASKGCAYVKCPRCKHEFLL